MTRERAERGQPWAIRVRIALGVILFVSGCTVAPEPASTTIDTTEHPAAPPREVSLTFPRTAATFLGQDELPSVDTLSRYDVVVIDNDWANRLPRSYFEELRRRDPRLVLLAYVDVVDSLSASGRPDYWRNAYELWQLSRTAPGTSTFPDVWLARTAEGAYVHEWRDRVMTNLTDEAPRVDGRLFVEYAVDWIIRSVWSAGIWDGVFLDVWGEQIYTADSDHWDINRDGQDENDSAIYGPGNPLDRGLTIGETRLRAALPTAILVANNDRTIRDQLLNGRVFESFMAESAGRDPESDLRAYIEAASSQANRRPVVTMTINKHPAQPRTPEIYREARFELAATLLQDGYWAGMGSDYAELAHFDETDGGGLGRGYLGHPLEPNPTMALLTRHNPSGTGSPATGVYRRDFENGIVLVNTTTAPVNLPLEATYRKLKGAQDPVTNDGAEVNSVSLDGHDAVILLR
jgi:hypothetical protein